VVIGRLLPDLDTPLAGWTRWEQRTWDRRYAAIERGEVAAGGQHVFSGNVSIPRDLFVLVGGFNTALKRAEDTELGYRLERAGAQFRFNGRAAGMHCGVHSFPKWRTIQYTYGRYDVRLADREGYGVLLPLGEWFRQRNWLNRVVVRAAVGRLAVQKLILLLAEVSARITDRAALQRGSHWSYSVIANILYWQGVADELGGTERLWERIGAPNTTTQRSTHHA
jgi:GT2 family glycosyltransferase